MPVSYAFLTKQIFYNLTNISMFYSLSKRHDFSWRYRYEQAFSSYGARECDCCICWVSLPVFFVTYTWNTNRLLTQLTNLFNISLWQKQFPVLWKDANVIPVYKKDSPLKPENYHPISLLSCLGKIMERRIHKHLFSYLKLNNIISPYQSGFQSGDSTINQFSIFTINFWKLWMKGKK